MTRLAPFAFAALATFAAPMVGAAPAAAQSLGVIHLPSQPLVLETQHPKLPYTMPSVVIPGQTLVYAVAPTDLPAWSPSYSGQASIGRAQTQRFVESHRVRPAYGAVEYGPFRVIDGQTVALLGETDSRSPAHFARLLREHPGLARLEMVECPGTLDDRANLELGRMIRRARLSTVVPANGSVRSGAVELFLAAWSAESTMVPNSPSIAGATNTGARRAISRWKRRRTAHILTITARWAWMRGRPAPSMP